jgi:acetolactate synthase I/II/III large subunit
MFPGYFRFAAAIFKFVRTKANGISKEMTIAEYLARRLREHGVTRFFGIPGGPSIPYMEAFRREGIDFILTSHEASAAVMADVTARLTGVTGVCHATFGPGATNLSTGVGGALLDRSPLIALTSEMPDEWTGRTAQMNIDHQALFTPLTKATFRLSAKNVPDVIGESLEIANSEYPGPVHIGLPSDLAECRFNGPLKRGKVASRLPDYHPDDRVKVLLASARRPVIAAGLSAMRRGAGDNLKKFLDNCNVPVVVTPMAKGIIPSGHPCYAGVLFHALSDRLKKLTQEADLVIGLGYDPVEYNYESWLHRVPLIHIDTVAADLLPAGAMQVVTGPENWFKIMEPLRSSPDMVSQANEAREKISAELKSASGGFTPATALSVLQEMLPEETVVTADVGSHLHLMGQMWNVTGSGRLIMTNGWSSMGFGLPAAIAAALVNRTARVPGDLTAPAGGNHTALAPVIRSAPVVCVTGDGGIMMNAGEMMTARRYGLKIIVVVLSDRELNLIRIKESWKNIKPYGTTLYSGSLFGSDTFMGAEVIQASDRKGMQKAASRALLSDRSVIIEAAVDPAVYSDLIVKP